ncbi:RICIN domain-containing protein [Kitasatospora aureofaciens]|uniref:RICIN domain-containing protein n=1 Tax=Kitasatospora aureofaciens TaxID=1894 RepID=UPI001C446ABA|nr:RICIN domain-containing protein [Kitasatospora aureofaciens]MBV6700311.1 RICIN domain-containing protein [Kitasatospora aureofaciens]
MTIRTKAVRVLSVAALAGACLMTTANSASASTGYPTNNMLRSENSGLCVDVSGASQANGAAIIQWGCNGGSNQIWSAVYYHGNNELNSGYQLVNLNSGKCLEVPAWSTSAGTGLDQWDCNGGTNQLWSAGNGDSVGAMWWNVNGMNAGISMVIDEPHFDKNWGTQLDQWSPNWGLNQYWVVR